MPSTAVLEMKKQQVAALSDRIKNSCAGVVVDYKGITVSDDTQLRHELREAYTVVKNTLLGRAAEAAGLEGLESVLEGTTAIATCDDDYVASARILQKFADGHDNFAIKSGYLDGKVIALDEVIALSKLPSREAMLAQIASLVVEPIACIARAVAALEEKGGATPVAAEAEEAPAEAAPAEEAPAEETAE
jgi:large subunit ribosomal protein L10